MAHKSIDPKNIHSIEVFPAIGIARVGNAPPSSYYLGPEVPGEFTTPPGGFKLDGKVRPQGVKFRVYAFDKNGKVLGELNDASGSYKLVWTVDVANKKAAWYTFKGRLTANAFEIGSTTLRNPTIQNQSKGPDGKEYQTDPDDRSRLIITPPEPVTVSRQRTLSAITGHFHGTNPNPVPVTIGHVQTDEAGRLIFVAGSGISKSTKHEDDPYPVIVDDFDNEDWVDDTCDGIITVQVFHPSLIKPLRPTMFARVIGSTPKFTSSIYAPTSLLDLMEDVYFRENFKTTQEKDKYVGNILFWEDIWTILRRAPLLSWVNNIADGGHGPAGRGNFFEKGWQAILSDPDAEGGYDARQLVLARLRLPDYVPEYVSAREGQAFTYFMPYLSGDGGDVRPGSINNFSSLTSLQYARIVKWAKGQFAPGNPPPQTPSSVRLESLPVEEQPDALTRASLELTIGAPLYPGIEMSWNATKPEIYNLKARWRLNDETVKPGDMTKYLSLPWQSDFYECRSWWWPSARPDVIVTKETYDKAVQNPDGSKLPLAQRLTDRVLWHRDLHHNLDLLDEDPPFFGNTDMAENWYHMGFVEERPSDETGTPIYVEVGHSNPHPPPPAERIESSRFFEIKLRDPGAVLKLPIPDHPPSSPEATIDNIETMKNHLQVAMAIELATIPLYLYGMYTIKIPDEFVGDPKYFDPTIDAIRGVVAEEMLHLTLAGNVLKSIGGNPKLYDPKWIPDYPLAMPGRVPKLTLHLRECTKINLQTFLEVELPETDAPTKGDDNSLEYHTLGEFYKAIEDGLEHLELEARRQGRSIFKPASADFQYAPGVGYVPRVRDAGGSVIVTDLPSAKNAITIIIDQGEGANSGEFDDLDQKELAHYFVFKKLLEDPTIQWDTFSVRDDPHTVDYKGRDPRLYQVSRAFDASYCYLLITIEYLWKISDQLHRKTLVTNNLYNIMMGILAPLAKFMVTQRIDGTRPGEPNASACFNYYDFNPPKNYSGSWPSPLTLVKREFQEAISRYLAITAETNDGIPLVDTGDQLKTLLFIQTNVNELLEIQLPID